MAGRIVKDDIEELRRRADIVVIVGDYTTVKRAGRSFKGLCPFHTEKTPSFTVTQEGNFFHCFGCGASGDIFDFLMRIEGFEFPEAVEALARRVGFTLRYEELTARQRGALGTRSRLVAVTAASREFYREMLFADEGAVARDYLRARGFGRHEAEQFGLGFAPLPWTALTDALTAAGHAVEDLVAAGMTVRTDHGKLRDRFRGRLVFPVEDPGGDVVGFGGRVLPDLDYGGYDPPKYLNSPETPLYRKAQVLYGLRQARAEVVRTGQVLICEGYTDVMALHQAGFANAVATCGTAVGGEHLRSIARYATDVVLAFDGDEAGVRAAERAWEAAAALANTRGSQLALRVLELDADTDPADLVHRDGVDRLRAAVGDAHPVVPFVLRHRLADEDLDSEAGRANALRIAIELVAKEPDPDLRREWARTEVADRIGLAYDFVTRSAERMGVAIDAHQGVAVATVTSDAPGSSSAASSGTAVGSARARRERAVLRVALQRPELLPEEWFEVGVDAFTHPRAQAIWEAIDTAGGAGVALDAVLDAAVDDELRDVIRALALEDDPELPTGTSEDDSLLAGRVAAERVRGILADRVAEEAQQLRQRLARLHHGQDADEVRRVQAELLELERRRRWLVAPTG